MIKISRAQIESRISERKEEIGHFEWILKEFFSEETEEEKFERDLSHIL